MRQLVDIAEKEAALAYVAERIGTNAHALVGTMPYEIGVVSRNGKPMGAVLYSNYRKHSIEITAAGDPGWITRGAIQRTMHYPFIQLGVWTLLALVNRNNTPSRELCRRIGFTELCVIETGGARGRDLILHSMTRDKCLWLNAAQSEAA
jgi:RimJ/RimL family protein N-acetyltransferase